MTSEHHRFDPAPARRVPSQREDDPLGLSDLIAAGVIDVLPGDPPVPIAVWHIADVDARYRHAGADAGTPLMATLMVAAYTRPGDTILSLGDDRALAGAAGAGGRTYRSLQHPGDLPSTRIAGGTVALIVLPWPPADHPDAMTRERLIEMFHACRSLMSPGGCTIVALAALPPDQTYTEHASTLIPAARDAGLGWLQHIIAITAPTVGQHITWRAAPINRATVRAATRAKVHTDLLVFAAKRFPATSAEPQQARHEPMESFTRSGHRRAERSS
jgi:hypothetical protein